MPLMGPLSRSKDGMTIHRRDCRYARVPWHWADDKQPMQIIATTFVFGYRLCRVCNPIRRSVS